MILLALNSATLGLLGVTGQQPAHLKRENRVQEKVGCRDKNLTETNDVLAATDHTARTHEKEKMDECRWEGLHKKRELDFTEANKMDGCGPSHPVSTASGSAV